MIIQLPEEYVSQQFLIYAGYARRKPSGIYEGGCPSCREGKSWGTKRRLFYIPNHANIHCKNCNSSWSPTQWIMEFSGKTFHEVVTESKEYEYIPVELLENKINPIVVESSPLPLDAINLSDPQQLKFYKTNDIVRKCINFIIKRRINKAINRPTSFYISLKDFTHKNRLCIPFLNDNGDISFYQTRSFIPLKDDPLPKYLGKIGGTKSVFGIDRISEDIDYIFIFEGPIDAMFVKNGVAIGGVTMNDPQKEILNAYSFHQKIWVLDNQHIDDTARAVTKTLLGDGETVFIWKDGLNGFKDFNDICMHKKVNEIPTKYIVENSFTGLKGKLQMRKYNL